MFTGIVSAGEITKVDSTGADLRIWVRSAVLGERGIGSSVSVDGVCLTVVERDDDSCMFDVSSESVARSTLGSKAAGDRVNVETPLRAGDDLGGHIVQGHVDGVGRITDVVEEGDGRRITVTVPSDLMRYIVEKGSVTLDGVSLTVVSPREDSFEVALVPHSLEITTFGTATTGREVNVEVDMFARYIEKLVEPRTG